MAELDFRKQLLINQFKTMSKGKSGDDLLPLILALSNKAKEANISFTTEDIQLVIDQISSSLTENERLILPKLLALINNQS